jgi:hypothetical protein
MAVNGIPMPEEYIKAAEDRIKEFSQSAGETIGPMTATAIHVELKAMFNVGKESEKKS